MVTEALHNASQTCTADDLRGITRSDYATEGGYSLDP